MSVCTYLYVNSVVPFRLSIFMPYPYHAAKFHLKNALKKLIYFSKYIKCYSFQTRILFFTKDS